MFDYAVCVYLSDLQAADSGWYLALTSHLTPAQQREIEDVFKLADQRKAASGKRKHDWIDKI